MYLQKYLFWLASLLALSSCSTYQMVRLSSQHPSDANQEFIIDNDTLTVAYNFSGKNCPVNIYIYNKLSRPIYIDWKKSALIIEGQSYSYWIEKSTLEAESSTSSNRRYTDTEGTIVKDERISFIPSQAYIQRTPLFVHSDFFNIPKTNNVTKVPVGTRSSGVRVDRYAFSPEDTPLQFRSLLTLATNEGFTDEFYYDSGFWISEIVQSDSRTTLDKYAGVHTGTMPVSRQRGPGNRFLLSKTTDPTVAVAALGLIGFLLFASSVAGHGM